MTLHSRFLRSVSAICCGTLIALPFQNGYVSSAAPDPATTLANSLRALQDGEDTAPRDHWDPKYVEAQLGNDPARTFAWVRDHTYWIPYHGILRGPVGVLMDRQGDSLDRALLLATMLKDEGQTVRLAHGTIPADRVSRLPSSLLMTRLLRQLSPTPVPRRAADLSRVATKYGLDPATVRTQLALEQSARAARQLRLDTLRGQISRVLAAMGDIAADADGRNRAHALTALADHWWVETQTGGAWRALDLVARDPSKALATPDRTIDPASMPANLYHQVTVRVIIERWAGGTSTETAALEQTFAPARTIGVPITLSIAPAQTLKAFPVAGQDPSTTFRAHAAAQHEWTPSLDIGRQHIVQNAITDSGNVTAPANDADALAVAKGVTHGLAGAIGDVFGSGPPASSSPAAVPGTASVLSAAWIEYQIAAPGETTETVRRQIFDLPGPAARASKTATWRLDDAGKLTRGLSLLMTTDILPVNCALAPQFVEHLSRQTLLANASLAQDIVANKIPDDLAGARTAGGRMVKTGTSLYDLAVRRLSGSPVAPLVYVDRPDVLTRHVFVAAKGNALVPVGATDIVANGVGVDPTAELRFNVGVAQGVFDTIGEAALYSTAPNAGNTAWAYHTGGEWVTIATPRDPALATTQMSADVRQRVNAALATNHIVILPRSPVSVGAGTFGGWWQVDRTTGDTLGMGETGWGQELAEYAVLTTVGWGFVNGWLQCKLAPASGGSPIVAANGSQRPASKGFGFDPFEARVEAGASNCLVQGLIGATFGLIGTGMGGGGSEPGKTNGFLPEDPVDPLAKTQPMPAVSGAAGGGPGTEGAGTGATAGPGGTGGTGGAGSGAAGGSGGGAGQPDDPYGGNGSSGFKPDPEAEAKYQEARRKYQQLFDSPDVLGREQALKEMLRSNPKLSDVDRQILDQDIQQLADRRAALGYTDPPPGAPLGQAGGGKVIVGDSAGGVDTGAPTQRVPVEGDAVSGGSGAASSGSGAGGDDVPPTLRSAGVGSGNGQSSNGQSGSGSSGGSGTLPGLGPSTPRTPTSPGLGACTPSCDPSGATTLVGLGGAIGALGGS